MERLRGGIKMLYKEDWDKTKKKYEEYWNRENHDRPLICIHAPKKNSKRVSVKAPENLRQRWVDTEYVIKAARANFENTFFGGEAFPKLCPNLGPDIFGAFYGADLEFGRDTSWAHPIIEDWDKVGKLTFNEDGFWYKKMIQMTKDIVEDSKGDYMVGITDLHPGTDGLVSLRGPENLCYDVLDYPEKVKEGVFELFNGFKKITDELYDITTKYQEGSTNWMGVWHPKKWYVTSSDFSCMISKDMYKEFVLPELLEELNYLDASIYHLDGPGALKHLDTLLDMEKLNGIQWVYGAGQPTASHWIPVLKKIQEAGKLIHINIVPEDLDVLLEEIKPEGVLYDLGCSSEEEARAILKKVENYRKR